MTQPDFPPGTPIWMDIFSSDIDRARDFYGRLFGWTSESAGPDFGNYVNFELAGRRIAGGMANDGTSGSPDGWNVYLASTDAPKTVDVAVEAGAVLVVPAMGVADMGTMAMLVDPTGAAVGLWQPGTHEGFGVLGEHGAPSWFELHTSDFDGAVAFYRHVMGWQPSVVSDTPELRYVVNAEEPQRAGIMDSSGFLPAGERSSWHVYIATDDADATLAMVTQLGGSVVRPAEDTPYGRLAVAADPTGAPFSLRQGS